MLASTSAILAFLALSVQAAKVFDPSTDVNTGLLDYHPPVTSPSKGDLWTAGQEYTVSWDNSVPVGHILSELPQTANIVLGFTSPDTYSLHLNWTLAHNVSLYAPAPASVSVTLPDILEYRTSYIIVILGSTSDRSEEFTILPSFKLPFEKRDFVDEANDSVMRSRRSRMVARSRWLAKNSPDNE